MGVGINPNEHRLRNLAVLPSKCTSGYGWHEQICLSALESGRARLRKGDLCLRPVDVHLH